MDRINQLYDSMRRSFLGRNIFRTFRTTRGDSSSSSSITSPLPSAFMMITIGSSTSPTALPPPTVFFVKRTSVKPLKDDRDGHLMFDYPWELSRRYEFTEVDDYKLEQLKQTNTDVQHLYIVASGIERNQKEQFKYIIRIMKHWARGLETFDFVEDTFPFGGGKETEEALVNRFYSVINKSMPKLRRLRLQLHQLALRDLPILGTLRRQFHLYSYQTSPEEILKLLQKYIKPDRSTLLEIEYISEWEKINVFNDEYLTTLVSSIPEYLSKCIISFGFGGKLSNPQIICDHFTSLQSLELTIGSGGGGAVATLMNHLEALEKLPKLMHLWLDLQVDPQGTAPSATHFRSLAALRSLDLRLSYETSFNHNVLELLKLDVIAPNLECLQVYFTQPGYTCSGCSGTNVILQPAPEMSLDYEARLVNRDTARSCLRGFFGPTLGCSKLTTIGYNYEARIGKAMEIRSDE